MNFLTTCGALWQNTAAERGSKVCRTIYKGLRHAISDPLARRHQETFLDMTRFFSESRHSALYQAVATEKVVTDNEAFLPEAAPSLGLSAIVARSESSLRDSVTRALPESTICEIVIAISGLLGEHNKAKRCFWKTFKNVQIWNKSIDPEDSEFQ